MGFSQALDSDYYPTVCVVVKCGKPLPPPYKRPFWLRGSDLCARHASFKKRGEEASREGRLYFERWLERERNAAAAVYESEFLYVKDFSGGPTRKLRASSLKAADAPERSRKR